MTQQLIQLAGSAKNDAERCVVINKLKDQLLQAPEWKLGNQLLFQTYLLNRNYLSIEHEAENALKLFPEDAIILALLAEAKLALGKTKESSNLYIRSANLAQDNSIINFNCGNVLRQIGMGIDSIEYYKKALKINNKYLDALINLGAANQDLGNLEEAEKCFRRANKINPNVAGPFINLAQIRFTKNEFKAARGLINHILKLGTGASESVVWAQVTLAKIEIQESNPKSAFKIFESIQKNNDQSYYFLKSYLSAAQSYCDIKAQNWIVPLLVQWSSSNLAESKNETIYDQFSLLACSGFTPELLLESAKRNSKKINIPSKKYIHYPFKRNNKIRLGYLTADFRDHPVAHLILGVLKNHNRLDFDVYAYDLGPENFSLYRYKGIHYVDNYKNIHGITAEKISRIIWEDQVDILIDLVGYTEFCQPQILRHRPAPVQISYLGFVGTTGMEEVDFIIADKIVLPESERKFYTERPIYLPRCFQATDGTLVYSNISRSDLKIPDGVFIFGSFNNSYKLNSDFLYKSALILKNCPDSIIWLYASNDLTRENLLREYKGHGIDQARVYFFERAEKGKFLGALSNIDLFLDSSPYNAGTTASDALYSGCPVLTLSLIHI